MNDEGGNPVDEEGWPSEEPTDGTRADSEVSSFQTQPFGIEPGSKFSDPEKYPELHRIFGESQKWATENGDPWPAIFSNVYRELVPAIKQTGPHACDGGKLRFALTADGSVTSRYLPYGDGSGLVLISQGLFALAETLARPIAEVVASLYASTGLFDFIRRARRAHKESEVTEYDLAVKSALIRYNLLNRLLLDNTGGLHYELAPAGERALDVIRSMFITFVVAHEVAHHLLGHGDAMRGFSPAEDLRQCDNDHQKEFDADQLAFRLIRLTSSNAYLPGLGPLLSFLAVTLAEECLYVRPGVTHPSAADRNSRILNTLPRIPASALARVSGQLLHILERTVDFSRSLSGSYW